MNNFIMYPLQSKTSQLEKTIITLYSHNYEVILSLINFLFWVYQSIAGRLPPIKSPVSGSKNSPVLGSTKYPVAGSLG